MKNATMFAVVANLAILAILAILAQEVTRVLLLRQSRDSQSVS
jgi:hypothetical protein